LCQPCVHVVAYDSLEAFVGSVSNRDNGRSLYNLSWCSEKSAPEMPPTIVL
jgi:hypothetical protein